MNIHLSWYFSQAQTFLGFYTFFTLATALVGLNIAILVLLLTGEFCCYANKRFGDVLEFTLLFEPIKVFLLDADYPVIIFKFLGDFFVSLHFS